MRTIKFRVWDKEEKVFFKPIYEAYKGHLLDLSIGLGGDILRRTLSMPAEHESNFPDKYELQQFTGLKDKNGVDIYEDSIFNCNGVNYVLKYKTLGGAYTVHNVKDDSDERFLHHCNHQIEIIGNILENPELL